MISNSNPSAKNISAIIKEAEDQGYNRAIDEIKSLKNKIYELEKTNNQLIKELKEKIKSFEWQKIVDEMAHSINTDVYVAVSNLEKHKDLPRIQKAFYHTKQIRDLINLFMWYIKRNELQISGTHVSLNIEEIIKTQLEAIKEGISTLRLSADEHQENILKMVIPLEVEGEVNIQINKEIADSITLILKDILRNAIKNTKEENPQVTIKITGSDYSVTVEVCNNSAIKENFSLWFNNESNEEPMDISKSMKVGLRVIKMWIDLLKINAKLIPNYQDDSTTAKIVFPKEIKIEQN